MAALDDDVSRPTLAEVALLAGVSIATASRVLSRSAPVADRTRARVEHAVAELGYVRQRAPAAGRDSGALSVVVFDDMLRYQRDSFYSRLLVGAERATHEVGLELVVLTALRHSPRDSLLHYLCGGHVDGVIMVGMRSDGAPARLVRTAGVPVICLGRSGTADLSYVDADNLGGALQAVTHLLASGRRSIATIAGPRDMTVADDRLAGYQQGLVEAGFEPDRAVCRGDFTAASGEHAMLRLLDRYPGMDAVFAASDLMAMGALRVLHRLGVRVPDEVAVVGFDDAALALHTMPLLTTVRQPVEEMGARSVAELLAQRRGDKHRTVVLPTTLVLRDSA
ncbi:MAG TPA: LacI family DNA-binding transcriptional regulator [Pseudonocardiaceae bacterium]|jgi:DNA-binding LacI/PurR family transcriptional regulator|nr:LacI family DNA-binding transcriptional regulator [Pseudonocardiaceae bacterium]